MEAWAFVSSPGLPAWWTDGLLPPRCLSLLGPLDCNSHLPSFLGPPCPPVKTCPKAAGSSVCDLDLVSLFSLPWALSPTRPCPLNLSCTCATVCSNSAQGSHWHLTLTCHDSATGLSLPLKASEPTLELAYLGKGLSLCPPHCHHMFAYSGL